MYRSCSQRKALSHLLILQIILFALKQLKIIKFRDAPSNTVSPVLHRQTKHFWHAHWAGISMDNSNLGFRWDILAFTHVKKQTVHFLLIVPKMVLLFWANQLEYKSPQMEWTAKFSFHHLEILRQNVLLSSSLFFSSLRIGSVFKWSLLSFSKTDTETDN